MSGAWIALLICTVATVAFLAAHLVTYRLTQGYMRAVFVGFVAGLLVLAAGDALRFVNAPVAVLEGVVLLAGDFALYVCAAYVLFNVINVSESSIRVRILRELRDAPISEAILLEKYNDALILDNRLDRLIGSGHIEFVDGRYRLASRTLARVAGVIRLLKRILLGRTSEFSDAR